MRGLNHLDPTTENLNVLLVGVGGQGTILASDILAGIGLKSGLDIKKAEIHGMSQRGGSVVSQVRFGKQVFSPIIVPGEVDVFIAFEKLEAVRYIHYLRPGGLAVVNDTKIVPISVNTGPGYPPDDAILKALHTITTDIHWVCGDEIAAKLGNMRASNVVLLGLVCELLHSNADIWLETIMEKIPTKYAEINRQAFNAGRSAVVKG
jgi:indolepyruvate ferredoxin oxidoreductase, beta subunit